MGVPNSEVGYTPVTARRGGGHESSYEHVEKERKKERKKEKTLQVVSLHTTSAAGTQSFLVNSTENTDVVNDTFNKEGQ